MRSSIKFLFKSLRSLRFNKYIDLKDVSSNQRIGKA